MDKYTESWEGMGCLMFGGSCVWGLVYLLGVLRVVLKVILSQLYSFNTYEIVKHGKPRYFSLL